MTRREEIKQYCIEQGFPQGACSSILEVKAIVATEAIKWADKTMIEKACKWLKENIWIYINYEGCSGEELENDVIEDFRKAMEE